MSEEAANNNATGSRPPVFDGNEGHYMQWLRLVGLWFAPKTDKEKIKAAGQLVLVQGVYEVQEVMLLAGSNEELGEIDGVEKIIKKMNENYAKNTEHLAWMAFFEWYSGKRTKGESCNE